MSKTKDLSKFSAEKLREFLTSFDIVLSDIDGVLWQINHPIEGGFESLAILQKLGKKIYLVTNNSENKDQTYCDKARCACLYLNPDHIVNIVKVIIWYLNKIDFRDEVFAIVSDESRNALKKAGIRIIEEEPKVYDGKPSLTIKNVLDRSSVKAVIYDFDSKCNWSKLALAISCLERKDVLYIAGATEEWIHIESVPSKLKILGPGSFIHFISAQSGRKPILCGKPSEILKDYILDTCNVTDPQRCLFIGDTINQDMRFASMCGFKKLFVGTGSDTLEEAQKDIDTYPDYYLPALSQLFSTYKDLQLLVAVLEFIKMDITTIASWLQLAIIIFGLFVPSSQCYKSDAFQVTLGHIRSHTSPEIQAKAAKDVAERLLGKEISKLFIMMVDTDLGPVDKDTFKVTKNPLGEIEIRGTSGVAITWGLHYYLKNYCNVHISWDGTQITLPNTLPEVRIKITSNDRFRYYQNVCTVGYSSTWWQWEHWERNIDWMALNGINLALAFTAQEAIWQRLYQELNLTKEEIDEHLGGPAFLPWVRMGNIRGFGGPLSTNWHNRTIHLQHQILRRMRDLGIVPVLPAFAGHVPRAFARLFPNANMTKINPWNNFEDKYCCPYLLEPTDPLFQIIGEKFLRMYIDEFGTDHIYNCDTFNENEPGSTELIYLRNVGHAVFAAINAVDSKAIWLMQAWLFVHDFMFWTEPRVKSFLTSVPMGRMLILDLQSEQFPQYGRLKSYYGQPFIWCMLHNFGGTLGMFGSAQIINQRTFEGRNMNGSTMVGTGLTPEGINQNYVIYELMNEMAYRHEPVDLDAWFENYATRRYGAWNEYAVATWQNLGRTVYNFIGSQRIRGHYVITRRPSLNISSWVWYNRKNFYSMWNTFLKARHGRRNSTLYRHDVVDITRQALQLMGDDLYTIILDSYKKKNITAFRSSANALLELFDDLESILASGSNFLVGTWLSQAKDMATNEEERKSYEYNAKNQITLWGPNGEIRDYANKQWSGVMADYFKPRWELFLNALEKSLVENTKFNITEINNRIFDEVERPFTFSTKFYPVEPKGDTIDIAMKIISKWYNEKTPSSSSNTKIC